MSLNPRKPADCVSLDCVACFPNAKPDRPRNTATFRFKPILGEGEPSDEEVVAISACIALITGRRSRVVSIRSSARDWNREGRREHFASHKIR
jgi:hypothetical protein